MKPDKIKVVYLRNPRVGSSAFIGMLKALQRDGHIDAYFGTHHSHKQIREKVYENKGKQFWDGSIKVVSVRNPWDQHVSYFLKTRKKEDNDIYKKFGIAKNFRKLPKRIQKKYINDFRVIVDQQLKYIRGEVSDVYDADSWHCMKQGKFKNAVRNNLARLGKLDQIYIHEGKSVADYCIRMEQSFLENDLEQFMKKINIPMANRYTQRYVAGAKRANYDNSDHYNYKEFYDTITMQAVKEIRKLEIDLHGYEFK